jgi:lysophospholipid acyltransferase (LPLAT)-like uncharacterized protein
MVFAETRTKQVCLFALTSCRLLHSTPNLLLKMSEKVFKFDDISGYSIKQRCLIRLADIVFYALVFIIGKTVKFEVENIENYDEIIQAGKIPIYTFWHNNIFIGTYYFRDRQIIVMSSHSFDGEYIARFIKRLGYGTVRGSSTRGGVGALIEMIRLMKRGFPCGFAIDGPKGPKYIAKSGACMLAKKTGNPIMPFAVVLNDFWTIKSWDDLQIPKPFSRCLVKIAKPIYVEPDSDDEDIENKRLELQKSLDESVKNGENWRNTKNK